MLRVVHVTDGSAWGGIEAHLLNLHRAARAVPQEVNMLIALTEEGNTSRRFRAEGAQVIVASGPTIGKFSALRRAFQRLAPDVIHVHGYLGALLGTAASMTHHTIRVATLHSSLEPEAIPTTRGWWYANAAIALLRVVDAHLIAVSQATALDWQRRGIPEKRITIIHNGIAPLQSSPIDPTVRAAGPICGPAFRIGILGRLVPVKDHALFLDTAAEVARRCIARFVIIGDGPLLRPLKRKATSLGIAKLVDFLGFSTDPGSLLSTLDVLLFTSRSEGIPYSVLEGMAAGIPIVAPRIGGLPEVLHDGSNALLASRRTASDLSSVVLDLLRDGNLRQRLSIEGLRLVSSELSASAMLAGTLAIYRMALTQRASRVLTGNRL